MNRCGQTAYDIARFWGHKHIAMLLSGGQDGYPYTFPEMQANSEDLYFNHEFLDRLSEKRTDAKWLTVKQTSPHTVFLLFHNLNPLVTSGAMEEDSRGDSFQLSRLHLPTVEPLLGRAGTTLVFLGVEKQRRCVPDTTPEGEDDGLTAWFSLHTEEEPSELLKHLDSKCFFLQAPMPGLLRLSDIEAGRKRRNSHRMLRAKESHAMYLMMSLYNLVILNTEK